MECVPRHKSTWPLDTQLARPLLVISSYFFHEGSSAFGRSLSKGWWQLTGTRSSISRRPLGSGDLQCVVPVPLGIRYSFSGKMNNSLNCLQASRWTWWSQVTWPCLALRTAGIYIQWQSETGSHLQLDNWVSAETLIEIFYSFLLCVYVGSTHQCTGGGQRSVLCL